MTIRIYQASQLAENSILTLDEPASHHLARVLRASVGEEIVLFNGQGGEYLSVIKQIDKKTVSVEIKKYSPREAESALDIRLAQCISRGEKMDYTIQKAVELGVKRIIPLFSERCNVKLDKDRSEKRLQHWQSIIVSACEQSGRNQLPELDKPQALDAWLSKEKADYRFVLSPHAEENSLKTLNMPRTASIVLLIGPEGGLSDREVHQAIQSGFLPLCLGPRILRTETAAVVGITVLQSHWGDM